jgi:excisionase family DNA binding protein
MEKQLLSIPEFCETVGLGETMAKRLIREGQVLTVKVGDRRLVPVTAVRDFVTRLVTEAGDRAGVA